MSTSASRPAGPLVAVVTGASSGFGVAIAKRLIQEPGSRLVLVARRAERLAELAAELGAGRPAGSITYVAVDLTADDAPNAVRDHVREHHGAPTLLVNNAGAGFRARFGEERGGWENVRKTMEINFDAVVRLTEALLPDLRSAAPSAIVNISSTAARVGRAGAAAYSASKAALALWSDGLRSEEAPYGVHVGNVLPGFVPTEGFPQTELVNHRFGKYILGTQEQVAEAVVATGLKGKAERYVPRKYELAAALRGAAPWLVLRAMGSDKARTLTPKSSSDD
ncbi:SDR family NAD(P)-dependent oxidoreductase [Patulibacter defluvii]|uniref:SDR family NAD(P)-dependent oxidoreductase n=1 Tax=Patulibacter defluvii TaxID=3095358 RepID=UPI002A758C10|nr:SDR family NAD(P)-dependent oxidoreductase [Patulibacter sp. DM4]